MQSLSAPLHDLVMGGGMGWLEQDYRREYAGTQ